MRTRLFVLVGALLASTVLTGCSPRQLGDVAITLDADSGLVAVIRTCEDTKLSGLTLAIKKLSGNADVISKFDGPNIKRRQLDFALAKPPKGWDADAPAPAKLDPTGRYLLEVSIKDTAFFSDGTRTVTIEFLGGDLVPGEQPGPDQVFAGNYGNVSLMTRDQFAQQSYC
jgi:hypothetical protein